MKKDAQYFYDEGVLRYEDGLKSAVRYFEKARELVEKDENTNEAVNFAITESSDLFVFGL